MIYVSKTIVMVVVRVYLIYMDLKNKVQTWTLVYSDCNQFFTTYKILYFQLVVPFSTRNLVSPLLSSMNWNSSLGKVTVNKPKTHICCVYLCKFSSWSTLLVANSLHLSRKMLVMNNYITTNSGNIHCRSRSLWHWRWDE